MQINKPLTAKEKKIRKRERAKQKRKQQNLNNFSFQKELVNLVSEGSEQEEAEAMEDVQERQPTQQVELVEEKVQTSDEKNIKISSEEYYLIVELGKFYRIRRQNERNHVQISTINQKDQLVINGAKHTAYSSSNVFIFCARRSSDRPIKFDEYISNLSAEGKQRINRQHLKIKNEAIVRSNTKIYLQETSEPWINLPQCVHGNDSLMLVGVKNTGKSTLAEFLLHTQQSDCALLDCDIGRNSCLEGCVSITSSLGSKKIWIGQLTPLNNLQTYIKAIRYLFDFYREKWFTKKLVVNTMGYLTGLGQFLLYEIYHIVKPKSVLALQSNGERYQLNNILHNIRTGNYSNRLYIGSNGSKGNESPSSTSIYYYDNQHSQNKKSLARFEKMFQGEGISISSIIDLIRVIKQSNRFINKNPHLFSRERLKIDIYQQSRHGKQQLEGQEVVSYRKLDTEESVDMRLIILGKMIDKNQSNLPNISTYQSSSNLFQVHGLGFGFQGKIYSKIDIQGIIGIVNQGMDFQKGFYHLNEKQLIDLQLRYGRLNFIMVNSKGLGSKGVRNNPSKVS